MDDKLRLKRIPTPVLRPPPAPRAHKHPCKNCPSAHFPPDPEAIDILALPHAQRVQHAFACGWNGTAYCKGYCDQNGISDEDLVSLNHQRGEEERLLRLRLQGREC